MNKEVTYFVSDKRMLLHRNEWDNTHIEVPERLECIIKILEDTKTLNECEVLESKLASIDDIAAVHSKEYIEEIRQVSLLPMDEREKYCSTKEDIYINEHTWESSLLAVGSSIHLLETILKNPGSNGFAAVRPPGHHSSYNSPCGFCIFNNVAICAKKAKNLGIDRVLIIDWDVHAGQGTQYCIENIPGIKLISIHRFEDGTFWPELPESAVEQSYKNTINIPLNELNYSDAEYAAILNFFILPLIQDWKPQLILVSCGYDAAIGDPQGNMSVSPGGFNYMTGMLASLNIPLCCILEGGYFLESIAYCALYTMKALIQKKPLNINLNLSKPSKNFIKFLFSIISKYAVEYPVFNIWNSTVNEYLKKQNLVILQPPKNEYKGEKKIEIPYPTRDVYPIISEKEKQKLNTMLSNYLNSYNDPPIKKNIIESYLDEEGKFSIKNISIQLPKNNSNYVLVIFYYILVPLSFENKILFHFKQNNKIYTLVNGMYDMIDITETSKESINNSLDRDEIQIENIFKNFSFVRDYYGLF